MRKSCYDPTITIDELRAIFPEAATHQLEQFLRALKQYCQRRDNLQELLRARKFLGRYPYPISPEDRKALVDLEP